MPKVTKITLYSEKTVNKREYIFTPKHHHGKGSKGQANWLLELTLREEFWVFAEADRHDYSNDKGKLYGCSRPQRPGAEQSELDASRLRYSIRRLKARDTATPFIRSGAMATNVGRAEQFLTRWSGQASSPRPKPTVLMRGITYEHLSHAPKAHHYSTEGLFGYVDGARSLS